MTPQEQVDALLVSQGGHADEDELIAAGVVEVRAYRGAADHISDVYEVELESGRCAYFKPTNGPYAQRTPALRAMASYGHTLMSMTISECAAWQLARRLGPPWEALIAPTVLRFLALPGRGREVGSLSLAQQGRDRQRGFFQAVPEQVSSGAFFDMLVGQQDRNLGNVLWDERARCIHLIDHAFTFGLPGRPTGELALSVWRWQHGSRDLAEAEARALRDLVADDLHGLGSFVEPERAAALERRAETMIETRRALRPGIL
jgi:hypothetical protein